MHIMPPKTSRTINIAPRAKPGHSIISSESGRSTPTSIRDSSAGYYSPSPVATPSVMMSRSRSAGSTLYSSQYSPVSPPTTPVSAETRTTRKTLRMPPPSNGWPQQQQQPYPNTSLDRTSSLMSTTSSGYGRPRPSATVSGRPQQSFPSQPQSQQRSAYPAYAGSSVSSTEPTPFGMRRAANASIEGALSLLDDLERRNGGPPMPNQGYQN
ncbi:hypothetical protein BC829DRAFT_406021 [Chytridium lagenaria]|nr:hypothetical protein BC829DRAFT_406021 [Chytridium lagenaria]